MRIFPISDLHLERRSIPLPAITTDFDVLVFAGDGHEGEPAHTVDVVAELAGGRPAVIVPGNHDYYRRDRHDHRTMADMLAEMRQACQRINEAADDDLIHVLTGDDAWEIEGIRFIGATLWGDWSIAGRWRPDIPAAAASAAARHDAVSLKKGPRDYEGWIQTSEGFWDPLATIAAHAVDRTRIVDGILGGGKTPTVVVTHAPPLAEITDLYQGQPVPWWTPAFYGSDFLREMSEELRPDVWISGHVHRSFDLTYGRTRMISNPVEGPSFNPSLTVELYGVIDRYAGSSPRHGADRSRLRQTEGEDELSEIVDRPQGW